MMKRRSFVARFDGQCAECCDRIDEGIDEIVMTDDGAIHLECDDTTDDPLVTFPI